MSNPNFLSESKSIEDLFSRMEMPDREICDSYKNLKSEAGFIGRIFIIYKATGLEKNGEHRPPNILTQIKVIGFRVDDKSGAEVDFEDMTTNEVMTIGYVPKRLFSYELFAMVSPRMRLNWEATMMNNILRRKISFGLLLKERSRADFYSMGATAIVTPGKFREMYPQVSLTLITAG